MGGRDRDGRARRRWTARRRSLHAMVDLGFRLVETTTLKLGFRLVEDATLNLGCLKIRLFENFILIFLIWEEHVCLLEEKCIPICGGYKPPEKK